MNDGSFSLSSPISISDDASTIPGSPSLSDIFKVIMLASNGEFFSMADHCSSSCARFAFDVVLSNSFA
jgi:hypothetical protein